MKYRDLLKELEDMNDIQLNQDVVLSHEGLWVFPSMVAVVKNDYAEEEGFQKFQTILA